MCNKYPVAESAIMNIDVSRQSIGDVGAFTGALIGRELRSMGV